MRRHPCPHSCCNSKRVHPANLPVKLDRDYLRSLSERELERELDQYMGYYEVRERGARQIMTEIDRRENAERRAARAKDKRERAAEEWRDEVYRSWFHAERETKGVMLNKAGLKAGIDERSLFTGPESRVAKYASPELVEYFESHPRPTRASFLGSTRERREHLSARRIG